MCRLDEKKEKEKKVLLLLSFWHGSLWHVNMLNKHEDVVNDVRTLSKSNIQKFFRKIFQESF